MLRLPWMRLVDLLETIVEARKAEDERYRAMFGGEG